jgi:hypothetical protein
MERFITQCPSTFLVDHKAPPDIFLKRHPQSLYKLTAKPFVLQYKKYLEESRKADQEKIDGKQKVSHLKGP